MLKIKSVLSLFSVGLILAGSNAYATCTPNVTNTSDSRTTSLFSNTAGDCVENSGSIISTNKGINSTGANSTSTNSGIITTTGNNANGIYSYGNDAIIINTGNITTNNTSSTGIYSRYNSVITNYGNITTNNTSSNGISSHGDTVTLTNFGTITTYGSSGWGMVGGPTNINYGAIRTQGNYSHGMSSSTNNSIFTNSGSINTQGLASNGIWAGYGSNSNVTNTGVITVSGAGSFGIEVGGSGSTITNSGTIRATGADANAIRIGAINNTVNLNRGSVIVGDIYALYSTKLNINLGSGASYAYSTTGTWTVSDLDNRPMVTGSAYAAGIGAQETASEMLYQRTSVITSALDRRLRSYASNEIDNQPYWLDVYYSDVTRNSGGNYSAQTAFSNYNYGITAGFKLPAQFTPFELVVNVEQNNLNIDSGNQKIDSSSIMAGLLAPNVTDVLGAKLSAKALVGYADHNGDRKVMTNSLLYDGSRQIKSDYNSTYAALGTALTKLYSINDRLTADVVLGLDLNVQRTESYKETDYFTWDHRTLTQLQSRVQTGLDYKLWGDKGSVFARVGAEHRDLIGGATQDYSINGTNVSFNTNNKNDTYLTAQVGIKAQLEKRIQLFGIVNTLHSSDSVNSVSGNVGLRADF